MLLTLLAALVAFACYRLLYPDVRGEALAYTECPFRGEPRVTITDRVIPEDTFPVRRHEEVHAQQCRELGPWRYRVRNLTSSGRLQLEAPAYCAGARARIEQGLTMVRARERLIDDATAAFNGLERAPAVRASLAQSCPEIVRG